jgi:hypothetical protein
MYVDSTFFVDTPEATVSAHSAPSPASAHVCYETLKRQQQSHEIKYVMVLTPQVTSVLTPEPIDAIRT